MEVRDSHEAVCEPQNMSVDDNPPGFESMGDEIDGALPLAEAEPVQPMELHETVSFVMLVIFFIYYWHKGKHIYLTKLKHTTARNYV